ncbi:Putative syntaxin-24 [Apostasia shenzhenica]|uniref:Syntaxin-24 n=1 Tax=Apostasia shenzhenica TaxID=1088818 RepID=A0A2I0A957_9ASPA|nr:Putative syntaxin-24 [Apostasia shenzhenica]
MADLQNKIYPYEVETGNPSAPLVPSAAARSEDKLEPTAPPLTQPPPPHRTIPVTHAAAPKKKRSCCCCRFLCWTILILILLAVAVAATAGILYLVFDPKIPKYSVDRLQITAFSVDANLTAKAAFDLTVTARNPNKRIGIYYVDGSQLNVWYEETRLCTGWFPVFYQGHRNTTTVTVKLAGEAELGRELSSALEQQQQTGSVPLLFKGDVPVKVKVGALKLWKMKARVRCDLVVNSLTAGNSINIKTSNCKFRLKL